MSSPRRSLVVVLAVAFLYAQPACAQVGSNGIGQTGSGASVRVRVVESGDRPVPETVRVDLLTSSGSMVSTVFTNSSGTAVFSDVPGGDYRLRVTGANVPDTLSGFFSLDARERNHTETLVVQPLTTSPSVANGPAVAVVDLNVPKPARKAVDKGVEAFNGGKFDEARKQFEKAIEQYPRYATAYNMLGLTFQQQREDEAARQSFAKAIELNDRFADAYTNLAKDYFRQQKYEMCEALLEKSVAAEPRNPEALTYLAQVELLGGKYEQAADNARRVHELSHQEFAIVHFIAARAWRARNRFSDAVAEYKLFLQEAPNATNSPQARKELAQLQAHKP